jgi:hypothetical protein
VTTFRVDRSPIRQFLFGVAGLLLIIAAVDVIWAHKLSEPPTTDADGVVTSRGQVDQRHDLIWGGLFLAVGGATALASAVGLIRNRPMLEIDESGVSIRLLGAGDMMYIPFHRIVSVRSGTDDDPDAAIRPRQLLVEIDEPGRFPEHLWGAEWQGNLLRIDTQGWSETAEEIAVRLGIDKARAEVRAAAARAVE